MSNTGESKFGKVLGKADYLLLPVGWPFVGVAMIFTALASLNLHSWIPDLLTSFYAQYFILELFFCIALVLVGRKWQALAVAPFLAICLAKIVFLFIPSNSPTSAEVKNYSEEKAVGVLQINVLTRNRNYDAVFKCVDRYSPDILLLEEVNKTWAENIEKQLAGRYTIVEKAVREDNFGILLFSKIPVVQSRLITLGYVKVPAVTATFEKDGKKFSFIGAHVLPPTSSKYFRERNLQYDEIALQKRNLNERLLLAGDLNTTAWSPYFSRLLTKSGLNDSSRGFGPQPTWPAFLGPFGLALEHCLHSSHFKVFERVVGPDVGSDHRPLYVRLDIVK